MPSQLYDNDKISFVVCKPFLWRDTQYEMGDDFPQEEANNIETMIRARFVIPVVDDFNDKPRHWHTHVRQRDDAMEYIFRERTQIVFPDVEPPTPSEQSDESGSAAEPGAGGDSSTEESPEESSTEYDPGAHTVAEVLAYMAEHPDEADAVRAGEAAGKNRKGIVEGY